VPPRGEDIICRHVRAAAPSQQRSESQPARKPARKLRESQCRPSPSPRAARGNLKRTRIWRISLRYVLMQACIRLRARIYAFVIRSGYSQHVRISFVTRPSLHPFLSLSLSLSLYLSLSLSLSLFLMNMLGDGRSLLSLPPSPRPAVLSANIITRRQCFKRGN